MTCDSSNKNITSKIPPTPTIPAIYFLNFGSLKFIWPEKSSYNVPRYIYMYFYKISYNINDKSSKNYELFRFNEL